MSGCCDGFTPNAGAGGASGGAGGITAISGGTTNATGPGVSFANSNNVSFGINGNTITASVVPEAGIGLSAGTQSMATGTAVFSNSNGVSFGLNASTITASVAAETPFAISGGTQSVSTGTVVFSNAGNVSFGMAGSATMTASASVAAIKSISGGTTNATGQGVSFANGSGVSFGVNGNTITASVAAETPFALSAGTQSVSTGTVSFANSNGVTFGMAGSNVITASVAAGGDTFSHSQFYPLSIQSAGLQNLQQSSLHIQPLTAPNVVFSQFNALVHFSGATDSTGTISWSYQLGVYTKNVSTLSLLMSSSISGTVNHSGTVNSSINNGIRLTSGAWSSTLPKNDYWFGVLAASTFSSQNASFRQLLVDATQASALSGFLGAANNATNQEYLGRGFLSVQTAALPSSVAFSDIRGTAIAAGSLPIIQLGQSV
jgi:hypothetical protein